MVHSSLKDELEWLASPNYSTARALPTKMPAGWRAGQYSYIERYIFKAPDVRRSVSRLHVLGLRPFPPVYQLILDLIAFIQIAVAVADDGRIMDEYLLPTVVRIDESIPLQPAKPFDNASLAKHFFQYLHIEITDTDSVN
jgi:hypothetical protein